MTTKHMAVAASKLKKNWQHDRRHRRRHGDQVVSVLADNPSLNPAKVRIIA